MIRNGIKQYAVLCLMSVFFIPDMGYAYYHGDSKITGHYFQHERCYGQWSNGERTFVVYDNFDSQPEKRQRQMIYPHSGNFIAVDRINTNLPFYFSIRQSSTVENSLANFLFANLELKKLLDEYEKLHTRARALSIGSLRSKINTGNIAENKSGSTSSIYTNLRELTRRFNASTRNARLLNSSYEKYGSLSLAQVESKEALSSREQGSDFEQQNDKKDKSIVEERGEPIDQVRPPSNQDTETSEFRDYRRGRVQKMQENVPLPLPIRVFFRIIKYVNENRIEVLIFVAGFIFLITLLSSTRRK